MLSKIKPAEEVIEETNVKSWAHAETRRRNVIAGKNLHQKMQGSQYMKSSSHVVHRNGCPQCASITAPQELPPRHSMGRRVGGTAVEGKIRVLSRATNVEIDAGIVMIRWAMTTRDARVQERSRPRYGPGDLGVITRCAVPHANFEPVPDPSLCGETEARNRRTGTCLSSL